MVTRTEKYLAIRNKHSATHYKGCTVLVAEKGSGSTVVDVEGNKFFDAVAGYSSCNLGHNHPKLNAIARKLYEVDEFGYGPVCVVPNSIFTVAQGDFLEYSCPLFKAHKALIKNGGVDGVEVALKLMLKYGYTRKGNPIPENRGLIIMFDGNFHGRTISVIAGSSEQKYKKHFGPFAGNIVTVPYNDVGALVSTLVQNKGHVAGLIIEPIQGEGGVRIPSEGYLDQVSRLCKKYNVIFCADEVQTGLGRTGTMLACEHDGVDPDMFILAKSLGAGRIPVSVVYAKEKYMCFEPGEDGSTYGGNTSAMTHALAVLQIIAEENLCEKSRLRGKDLMCQIKKRLSSNATSPLVKDIRGRGLMIGIELAPEVDPDEMVDLLLRHGVITKDAHGVIRITPPLVIKKRECWELAYRIGEAFHTYARKHME